MITPLRVVTESHVRDEATTYIRTHIAGAGADYLSARRRADTSDSVDQNFLRDSDCLLDKMAVINIGI
jgi:hypothetical protein